MAVHQNMYASLALPSDREVAHTMLAALVDTADMLPVAARLHPDDLLDLQTRIVNATDLAEAAGIGE